MPPVPRRDDVIPFEEVVPHDIKVELCVLGSLLLDNEVIHDVAAILSADDFYRDSHRTAYEAILAIHGEGSPVDAILLSGRLQRDPGRFEGMGGDHFLREILEAPPHAANAVFYAQVVRQLAVARSLQAASRQVEADIASKLFDADQLLERAESRIFAIGEAVAAGSTCDLSTGLDEAEAAMERRRGGELSGLSSGLRDLDDILDGFQPGSLTILAARPSMGKTAFALNICDHAAVHQGVRPYLVSLEMGRSEVAMRMLQSRSRVDGYRLKKPWLMTLEEKDRLQSAAMALRENSFPIDDTSCRTIGQVAANARRLKARRGIGLVVVDYLQLIDGDDARASRQEQVARVSSRLKQIARELQVPVIALSQLNRQAENREDHQPRMSDLRESGAIEQDADAIILLHRPDYYDPEDQPGLAEAIVAKNRNGATDTVRLVFARQHARFDGFDPGE